MNKYEAMIEEADICTQKATKTKDGRLKRFFAHAETALRKRAGELLVSEVV